MVISSHVLPLQLRHVQRKRLAADDGLETVVTLGKAFTIIVALPLLVAVQLFASVTDTSVYTPALPVVKVYGEEVAVTGV